MTGDDLIDFGEVEPKLLGQGDRLARMRRSVPPGYALAEVGKRGELREYGKIANTPAALRTLPVLRIERQRREG